MKAILIDVENKEIREVDYSGDYRDISKMIGCEYFTIVGITCENVIYVDDEGLLKDNKNFFKVDSCSDQLAGNGLILGVDSTGDTISTILKVSDVEELVGFIDYDNHEDAPQANLHVVTFG